MTNADQIREHMKVIGSDGQHIGTVDGIEGNKIILTKGDPSSGGQHHSIPMDMVGSVGKDDVRLNLPAEQVRQQWQVSGGVARGQASGGMSGS